LNSLQKLGLERVIELGQEAFTAHEELMRWREKPLDAEQSTVLSMRLKQAIEKQRQWANALFEQGECDES